MRPFARFFTVAVVALLIGLIDGGIVGYFVGWERGSSEGQRQLNQIVAMKWGDSSKYGPALYGAHVYLEPAGAGGYSVRARVHIGRGDGRVDYFHDCGELGTVQYDYEAVARWGTIDWRADGLHIGTGTNEYFLERAKIESHR
jgi:hypothetical protein